MGHDPFQPFSNQGWGYIQVCFSGIGQVSKRVQSKQIAFKQELVFPVASQLQCPRAIDCTHQPCRPRLPLGKGLLPLFVIRTFV